MGFRIAGILCLLLVACDDGDPPSQTSPPGIANLQTCKDYCLKNFFCGFVGSQSQFDSCIENCRGALQPGVCKSVARAAYRCVTSVSCEDVDEYCEKEIDSLLECDDSGDAGAQ